MAFLLAVLAAFGLIIGSLLNVCIVRLPQGRSIAFPGSHCPKCGDAIAWYDNVPVLSYLVLGGRCRKCQAPISLRYPLVELVTAAAFVGQGLAVGDDWPLLGSRLLLTAALVVLFGTDLEVQRLPNVITMPGIVVGILLSVWLPPGPGDSLIGAALGAAILGVIRWGWKRATGVEGMGLGDVKMLAMVGAFLGWQQVWLVLFLASLAGAVVGVAAMSAGRRSRQARLPFGTFLAIAAFVASIAGPDIVAWYVGLYSV